MQPTEQLIRLNISLPLLYKRVGLLTHSTRLWIFYVRLGPNFGVQIGLEALTLIKTGFCEIPNYDKDFNYRMHRDVVIGPTATLCLYCRTLKFQKETSGMSCSEDIVNLPLLAEPPELFLIYMAGTTTKS